MTCCCGVRTAEPYCAYCRRTIELIRLGRCVSCRAAVQPGDSVRVEGLCAECRERHVALSKPTRRLLRLAAKARYRARMAA
jgi:hypothetical protein